MLFISNSTTNFLNTTNSINKYINYQLFATFRHKAEKEKFKMWSMFVSVRHQ